jgi:hypothetical protein
MKKSKREKKRKDRIIKKSQGRKIYRQKEEVKIYK